MSDNLIRDPLIRIRNEITDNLKITLSEIGCPISEIILNIPPLGMGDFSYPCFAVSKKLNKSPDDVAKEIANILLTKIKGIEKIQTKEGYINFYLSNSKIIETTLRTVYSEKEDYGVLESNGKTIILEHTSANPTGPLHVGRARNPIIGDTLARLFRKAGYKVTTEYYINDAGKQVAMLIWGAINAKSLDKPDDEKPDHTLVRFYQYANTEIEKKDSNAEKEINQILLKMESGDNKVLEEAQKCIKPIMTGINQTLQNVNISIDNYMWESSLIKNGEVGDIVRQLNNLPDSKQEDGAFFLDFHIKDLNPEDSRFFYTRKDGTTLYTTRDIAYHLDKFKRCDMVINVLGEDQRRAMDQLKIALKLLNPNLLKEKMLRIIYYSFVSLPEGRMSTRTGKVVYLDDLMHEAVQRAYNEVTKRRAEELSDEKMRSIAKDVGIGAIRYNIVRVQPDKQIEFKWEDALNFEGNSAPYIQYSHARACSILRKAEVSWFCDDKINYNKIAELLNTPIEIQLIKKIMTFPSLIRDCAQYAKIHPISNYAHELAEIFNQFYRDCPVLSSNEETRKARLLLVEITKIVMRNTLNCLGINAPEEM